MARRQALRRYTRLTTTNLANVISLTVTEYDMTLAKFVVVSLVYLLSACLRAMMPPYSTLMTVLSLFVSICLYLSLFVSIRLYLTLFDSRPVVDRCNEKEE